MTASFRKFTPTLLLVLCCSVWIASGIRLAAQTPHTGSITVHITGIRNADGNLRASLRSDENTMSPSYLSTAGWLPVDLVGKIVLNILAFMGLVLLARRVWRRNAGDTTLIA